MLKDNYSSLASQQNSFHKHAYDIDALSRDITYS